MVLLSDIGKAFGEFVVLRLGTVFAVWLLAQGIPQDVVDQFIHAIVGLVSIGVEVVLVLLFRGKVI